MSLSIVLRMLKLCRCLCEEPDKMYNNTIEQALDSFKLKEQSNSAYKELLENTGNSNENSNL